MKKTKFFLPILLFTVLTLAGCKPTPQDSTPVSETPTTESSEITTSNPPVTSTTTEVTSPPSEEPTTTTSLPEISALSLKFDVTVPAALPEGSRLAIVGGAVDNVGAPLNEWNPLDLNSVLTKVTDTTYTITREFSPEHLNQTLYYKYVMVKDDATNETAWNHVEVNEDGTEKLNREYTLYQAELMTATDVIAKFNEPAGPVEPSEDLSLTFNVTTPYALPTGANLVVAGAGLPISEWNPLDPDGVLTKVTDVTYTITFTFPSTALNNTILYKYIMVMEGATTETSWNHVETTAEGTNLDNRNYTLYQTEAMVATDTIARFAGHTNEEIDPSITEYDVTFNVTIPVAIPEGAKLKIAGTLNSWNPLAEGFALTKVDELSYTLNLVLPLGTLNPINYKYVLVYDDATEANKWTHVEGDASGGEIGNRVLNLNEATVIATDTVLSFKGI